MNQSTLPPPPWLVAGVTVWLEKNIEKKELRVCIPQDVQFASLSNNEILELVEFTEVTAQRFERVVPPGWKVLR